MDKASNFLLYYRMTSMAEAIDTLLSVQEKNGASLQALQSSSAVTGNSNSAALEARLASELTPKIVGEVNSKLCEFSGMIESLNADQATQIQDVSLQLRVIGDTHLKKIEEVGYSRLRNGTTDCLVLHTWFIQPNV